MWRTSATAVLGLLCWLGTASGQQDKLRLVDPPKQLEGTVKKVDREPDMRPSVTISFMDRQPTDQEDISREVQREHRFEVPATTKVMGLDGKPDRRGLATLKEGDKVRVE